MSDYERYGDYNDIEDEAPKKNPILLAMRILTGIICALVIGILLLRLILFSSYPNKVKNIYFNDTLTEYYNSTAGNINAKTQELRFEYEDPKTGYFFCKHLILIEDINQLQITVRYKTSNIKYINENFETALDPQGENLFTYRLCSNKSYEGYTINEDESLPEDAEPQSFYLPSADEDASRAQYRYKKLVFDGVDFDTENDDDIKWMRLEILLPDGRRCASVLIYENNEKHSQFEEYKLSKDEAPE